MKTIIYLFFLIVIGSGCNSKDKISPKTARVDDVFGLKYKGQTTLKVGSGRVTLALSDIDEGRCIGKNIVCIWGGYISVSLLVDTNTPIKLWLNGLTLDQLNSLPAPAPTEATYLKEARIKLNDEPYIIRFEKVDVKNPNEEYIRATPKENYTVWLKIFKSDN